MLWRRGPVALASQVNHKFNWLVSSILRAGRGTRHVERQIFIDAQGLDFYLDLDAESRRAMDNFLLGDDKDSRAQQFLLVLSCHGLIWTVHDILA